MSTLASSPISATDELLRQACTQVAAGYLSRADIHELLYDCQWTDGCDEQQLKARVQAAVDQAIRLQLKDQESYPAVTDYDRLRQAFAQLEAAGYLVRENYTCCQSCGWSALNDELAGAVQRGGGFLGAVFFHQQDTETAVEGHGLYLAYAGREGAEAAGREVTRALQAAGLTVDWNGEASSRILVHMTWQRRHMPESLVKEVPR